MRFDYYCCVGEILTANVGERDPRWRRFNILRRLPRTAPTYYYPLCRTLADIYIAGVYIILACM